MFFYKRNAHYIEPPLSHPGAMHDFTICRHI